MSCNNDFNPEINCENVDDKPYILLINASDCTIDKKTGQWRMKRKYGKFLRQAYKVDRNNR